MTRESNADKAIRTGAYSEAPCEKCGALKVSVSLEDEPNGCGTYYKIDCHACGRQYLTDGPDA